MSCPLAADAVSLSFLPFSSQSGQVSGHSSSEIKMFVVVETCLGKDYIARHYTNYIIMSSQKVRTNGTVL